ncbi:MAG: DUF432 domain-containing protein [bacterium]
MYGTHNLPFHMEQEGLSISFERNDLGFIYTRTALDDTITKVVMPQHEEVLINPVEPLNKPKALTSLLYIDLENVLMLAPRITKTIYLLFPIEIGVFIVSNGNYQLLDILSLVKQKFTLYGDPKNGLLCKYYKSEVYSSPPALNSSHQGIIELHIFNSNSDWAEVKKIIFNAYGMKIYYDSTIVSMKASLKLKNAELGETDFEDTPLKAGQEKSLEVYTSRKLAISSTKFVMEFGI